MYTRTFCRLFCLKKSTCYCRRRYESSGRCGSFRRPPSAGSHNVNKQTTGIISSYRSKETRDGERGMLLSECGIYSYYNICLYIAASHINIDMDVLGLAAGISETFIRSTLPSQVSIAEYFVIL